MQWDRVLDSRIVSIESDDVFHTHLDQFLQCQCTVEGFSAGTSVLAALIQKWHDHVDSSGFSGDGSNDSFQVLIMIIRGHMVGLSCQRICQTVVADIYQNIDIITTYGFLQDTFCFSGTETGKIRPDQVSISVVAFI